MADKLGVQIQALVANGSGEESKFARQLQTMVDRIPDSKLPKITVQIDQTKTKQVFQKQLNEIMKSLSLDTKQLKELNSLSSGSSSNNSFSEPKYSKQLVKYYKDIEKQTDAMNKKQINGIDAIIKKREEESRIFSNQIKGQMVERIQADASESKELNKINSLISKKLTLLSQINNFEQKNINNLSKEHKEVLNKLRDSISSEQTVEGLKNQSNAFKEVKLEAASAGETAETTGQSFAKMVAKFSSWYGISQTIMQAVQTFKNMIGVVIDLDSSLVEIQKVTDLSGESLKRFTQQAFEMGTQIGRTGKEVIDATAEFKRAGYTLNESMELAKSALVMKNVGDGIRDTAEASSYLISVLKGFNMDDSQAMSIVDAINETSNNAAIDFANIAEGLRRTSSTFAQAGVSLPQSIGLITGAFGQLRDVEVSAAGLSMISQRLRGIDEDGSVIDGLVPKLQSAFKEFANIDIEDSNGELRNTYDILSDLHGAWDSLSTKERQYLGELAAGNRQVKVLNSVMSGWKDVEKAVDAATNSQNSADKENAVFVDSIQGRMNAFATTFAKISQQTINGDLIKNTVSFGDTVLKIISEIIDKGMGIPTLFASISAGASMLGKNAGKQYAPFLRVA